ncbi:protein of unknown function DUF323 [Nitrosococcus halophilus Nc 4]|uniref:Protein kinase domain-containing protein n=1 Tax=Nitrosococcus halophilus (strain Nc4) TaxID=472759 RepID=D5BYT0_NITHN|nr:SUMF1/EgtB/PvdO family nonheme iron enzyme [Nitrosococcus halophilus]ADE16068.1 protein of unknown function DUF323 [Nitrosococcus halophilus Nc 4]
MTMDPLNQEHQRLKERLERGEMTPAEYEKERQRLEESAGQGQSADPFETPVYHPPPSTRLTNLAPGLEIGPEDHRFRLVCKIGGGAMGQVWQAHDLVEEELEGGERYKALKVIHPQLQDLARALKMLKREAVRASQLTHPNIINVRGCRQGKDGWLFVVMDYLEGRDLDRLLLEDGKPGLSWERTRELLKPLAEGLDYAHTQGVLHRDLKPGNVFITHEGQVKLLDFGLAYRLHQASTLMKVEEPDTSGTPEYMPPEAFVAGEPDKSRDIYALACLTYEMLTGEPPYNPQAAVQRQPDLMPGKPEGLTDAAWEVLQSGLAYHKENRPESAGELVQRLEAAQAITPETGEPEEAPARETAAPESPSEKAPEHSPGGSGRPWLIGLVLLVMGGGVFYLWEPEAPSPPPVSPPREREEPKPKVPSKPELPSPQKVEAEFDLSTSQRVQVQRALDILGHDPQGVDGIFGPKTEDAIRSWQRAEGLEPTGDLTQATYEQLMAAARQQREEKAPRSSAEPKLPPMQNIHGWSSAKVEALQRQTAEALEQPVVFQDRLGDGSRGPEMVIIPAGEFLMGSPESEAGRDDGEEQHSVQITRPFAIGRYEVTFEDYDRFAVATGRDKPDDEGWGRGRRPVINVSWHDATAYAAWLSEQTGQKYRLPTEAEWEYAARAGTVTARYWGENSGEGCEYANAADRTAKEKFSGWSVMDCQDGYVYTARVGSFRANNFGLHDALGNVWEWTCSEYDENYSGAETRCISKNHAGPRVFWGGSWDSFPHNVRSANRFGDWPDYRNNDLGFRLARDL